MAEDGDESLDDVRAYTPEDPRPLDVFIAGDDAGAKARVSLFVECLALRPLDVGDLASAR